MSFKATVGLTAFVCLAGCNEHLPEGTRWSHPWPEVERDFPRQSITTVGIVDSSLLYLADSDLFSLDVETGSLNWTLELMGHPAPAGPIDLAPKLLGIRTRSRDGIHLNAVNPATGELSWLASATCGSGPTLEPRLVDQAVCFGSRGQATGGPHGFIVCVDRETGEVLLDWEPAISPNRFWQLQGGWVGDGSVLYFTTQEEDGSRDQWGTIFYRNHAYSIDFDRQPVMQAVGHLPVEGGRIVYLHGMWFRVKSGLTAYRDGEELWTSEEAIDWAWRRSPVIGESLLLAKDQDERLLAVHLNSGRTAWRYPKGNLDIGFHDHVDFIVDGGMVYYVHRSEEWVKLVGLELPTGRQLWQQEQTGRSKWIAPLDASGDVLLFWMNREVAALEPATGAELWRVVLGFDIAVPPRFHGGLLLVGSDQALYAIDPSSA